MTMSVKVDGAWKDIIGAHVKVDGTWKKITNGYVRENGVWKEFYSAAPAGITMVAGQFFGAAFGYNDGTNGIPAFGSISDTPLAGYPVLFLAWFADDPENPSAGGGLNLSVSGNAELAIAGKSLYVDETEYAVVTAIYDGNQTNVDLGELASSPFADGVSYTIRIE